VQNTYRSYEAQFFDVQARSPAASNCSDEVLYFTGPNKVPAMQRDFRGQLRLDCQECPPSAAIMGNTARR
jgi:hypothetical protein